MTQHADGYSDPIPADVVAAAYVELTVAIVALDDRVQRLADVTAAISDLIRDALKQMIATANATADAVAAMMRLYESNPK